MEGMSDINSYSQLSEVGEMEYGIVGSRFLLIIFDP